MLRLARPWSDAGLELTDSFGPQHCLLSEVRAAEPAGEHIVLMRTESERFVLHPYPKRGTAKSPSRVGFSTRPRKGTQEDASDAALAALNRMNEVTARIQELGDALTDPTILWSTLAQAWDRAEEEEDPKMAEIVRQAVAMPSVLKTLRESIRRVLRRHRELTSLDRVQEMDRSSMRWMSRQPGRTIAERAGAGQRILAVVRHEDFDTLENRVANAYVNLAGDVGREWLRAHPRAVASERYKLVASFVRRCKTMAVELSDLGVGRATADITPNYVLMENKTYRLIREAWESLLRREKALDELWAWQAQSWTDFSVLAIVLALHELPDASLIAQGPISFREEVVNGIWFDQERPIAVFWLKDLGRVVEVMARPEKPGTLLMRARAHVALRISNPFDDSEFPHRVAVWTPHAMTRLCPAQSAKDAASRIDQLRRIQGQTEVIRHGLILTPGHHEPETATAGQGRAFVEAICFDAVGASLAQGREAIRAFLHRDIWGT